MLSNYAGCQPIAHACNHSYSGGRNQKDRGSKSAQANSLWDYYLTKIHHKKGLVKGLKVQALSSSPSTAKTKPNQNSFLEWLYYFIYILTRNVCETVSLYLVSIWYLATIILVVMIIILICICISLMQNAEHLFMCLCSTHIYPPQ
jgi:hypothetical protein